MNNDPAIGSIGWHEGRDYTEYIELLKLLNSGNMSCQWMILIDVGKNDSGVEGEL